ncbi:beta strand repeat-containing protein [Luteolibacter soli]|uniref:Immunoglobulin domain-containing protein n=1 Tax=Luteolibacter soli TaxID=3135280 RepID=A0ABU9B1R7_9BACT
MKKPTQSYLPLTPLAFGVALLIPLATHAAPMAYEGFDYPAGSGSLTGKAGGSGWNGAWQTVSNASSDVSAAGLTASASAPAGYDLRSLGRASFLPNGRRVGRKLDITATGPFGSRGYVNASNVIGADNKTIYLSFLQQANGTSNYYEFEFHRGNLGDAGRIGGIGNDQGGTNVNLRAPNGTHTAIGAGDTNVNFYVVRIDFKNGNDDVYVYRNPTSLTEPASPTLIRLGAADMSFDGISFGAFNNSRTVAHDEVRIGETWADVTVPPNAAPVIVKQPRAATQAYAGSTVVLTTDVTAQPLPTYQWYKGSDPLGGETNATLTLGNAQPSNSGAYHLVATNSQGNATTTDAQVTVETAPAGLLAYEGFDYDTGPGATVAKTGGLGWGAAWTNVSGGGSDIIGASLVAGTNAPNGHDLLSHGNASFVPNGQRDGRLLDATTGGRFGTAGYVDGSGNIGADGKTIYISFLQQPDGTTKFFEFEFHRGNLGDPGRIGGIGNDTGNATISLRAPNGTQTVIGAGSTGVNFYVVRINFKAGNDDVLVYQNPVSATEPGVPTLTRLAAADMSFNGISLAAFDGTRTVKHDEIRIGQSWSDVVFGTSRRNLTWVGDGTTNAWNFLTPNWNDGVAATTFADGDPVSFGNTGSATPAVNVSTNVSTASFTVDSSSNNYTFGGTGTITSSGGLHKLGAGSLTLTSPLSSGSSLLLDAGEVALNGTSTVSGNLVLIGASGNLTLGGNNTFTGSLLDSGSAIRSFTGTSSFGGITTTNATLSFTGTTNFTGGGATIWLGNITGAHTTATIEPGAVINVTGSYVDDLVFGRDGGSAAVVQNGGTFTYTPANRANAFIGASGANTGTASSYQMNGGTLNMPNIKLGLALGGTSAGVTGSFTQAGGSVSVRQLELGSTFGFGTATCTLNGGTFTIGTGGITTTSGLYTFALGGSTISAAADWQSPLAIALTGTGGNTTFDTAGHTIRLTGALDGTGGLVKTGAGTLILNGLNSFSGTTAVQAGTLGGNGNSDNSALTVASGATLAPGDADTAVFFCSSADLAPGSTLHVKIDGEFSSADQVQSFGTIDIAGATLTLGEIGASTLSTGTEFAIVDASGGVTGTFASLPEGATISSGLNSFVIHYTPFQVQLVSTSAASPYLVWATSKGLDGSPGKENGFNDDPEKDGIANGLEWVLGGNPLVTDNTPLITVTGDGSQGLTLEFDRDETSIGEVDATVQWAATLNGTWTDVPITQSGGSYAGGITVTIDEETTPDHVIVTIPASNAPTGKLFARITATTTE